MLWGCTNSYVYSPMEFSSTREYLQNIEDSLMFKNVKCSKAAFDDDISNVKIQITR